MLATRVDTAIGAVQRLVIDDRVAPFIAVDVQAERAARGKSSTAAKRQHGLRVVGLSLGDRLQGAAALGMPVEHGTEFLLEARTYLHGRHGLGGVGDDPVGAQHLLTLGVDGAALVVGLLLPSSLLVGGAASAGVLSLKPRPNVCRINSRLGSA